MHRIYVAIGLQDQFAAVAVSLPLGDDLNVNTFLDCAGDEHSAQAPVRERRKAESLASIRQRLARFIDREQALVVPLAFAEFFNQRTQLRIDRDHETDVGFGGRR